MRAKLAFRLLCRAVDDVNAHSTGESHLQMTIDAIAEEAVRGLHQKKMLTTFSAMTDM